MNSKQKALEQFWHRRQIAGQIEKVANPDLPAGSPLYFYCRWCGLPTEILPEDYLFTPHPECSQCRGMMKEGWLEDAVGLADDRRLDAR